MKNLSFDEKMKQAKRGYRFWRGILKAFDLDKSENKSTAVALLPRNDEANIYYAIAHLSDWLTQNDFNRAILLYVSDYPQKLVKLFCKSFFPQIKISDEEYEELIQFSLLSMNDKRFIITSLSEPEYRNGYVAINKNGLNVEELVCYAVYRLDKYIPAQIPKKVIMSDKKIMEFLSRGSICMPSDREEKEGIQYVN